MPKALNQEVSAEIINLAFKICKKTGIKVPHPEIRKKIGGHSGFKVTGDRVSISDESHITGFLQDLRTRRIKEQYKDDSFESWRDLEEGKSYALSEPVAKIGVRATMTADAQSGSLHPMTRQEVVDGTRFLASLNAPDVVTYSCGTPQDIPASLQAIEQYVVSYRYNEHGGKSYAEIPDDFQPYLSQIRSAAEGEGAAEQALGVWLISPLTLEGNGADTLMNCGGRGIKGVNIGAMPIMGLTGPVDPMGVWALALAETLGAAVILNTLFPAIRFFIHPHPVGMDPYSGLLASGSDVTNKLDLMKKDVFEHLGLRWIHKECLNGSVMPDPLALADKALSISTAAERGFTSFRFFPLCSDEVWSKEQTLLDVYYFRRAMSLTAPVNSEGRSETVFEIIQEAARKGSIIGSLNDTASHLRRYYNPEKFKRSYSVDQWRQNGKPALTEILNEEIRGAESRYRPPEDRWNAVFKIYKEVCEKVGVRPLDLDE